MFLFCGTDKYEGYTIKQLLLEYIPLFSLVRFILRIKNCFRKRDLKYILLWLLRISDVIDFKLTLIIVKYFILKKLKFGMIID
jgi:hypothetical protein